MKNKLLTFVASSLFVLALPLLVSASATITGNVTYEDTGAAVTNAWVNIWPENGEGGGGDDTNANGQFSISVDELAAGDSIWWNAGPNVDWSDTEQLTELDWASANSRNPETIDANGTLELNITVTRTTATLSGYVYDENGDTGVMGNIQITNEEGDYWGYTSDNGYYFLNVPDGTYQIYFYPDTNMQGDQDWSRYYYEDEGTGITVAAGSNTNNINLAAKNSYVDVTTVDQDSQPLEGVWVELYSENSWNNTETDSSGEARLWIKSDVWYESNVWSDTYIYDGEPQKVKLSSSASTDLTFTLQAPDASINASVVDENGDLVDTYGSVWCNNDNYTKNYNGNIESGQGSIPVLVGSGSFSGMCNLWVPEELGAALPVEVEVASGGTDTIEFSLIPKDATVTVWVKDVDGNVLEDLSGGEVYVWNEDTQSWFGEWLESGAGGQQDIAVIPGKYTGGVWFEDSNYIPLWNMNNSKVEVASGETANLVLTVLAANGTLTGTALDPDGNPAEYGWVYCGNWQEMENTAGGDFETGIMIDAGGEVRNGEFSVALASGHEYMCGIGLPPEFVEQGWMSPIEQSVTYESESDTIDSLTFQFTQADSSVSGTVNVASDVTSISSVDDLERVWCWSWAEDGGHSYSETNVGEDYTLPLTSGRTWHIGCDAQEGNNWYWTEEKEIEVDEAGDYSQDLTLELSDWVMYDSVSETFDATSTKVISLPDGTSLNIPANALATSGNVTVTATPQAQIVYTGDKLVNVPWNFEAFNSENQLIESFNSNVTITINYDDSDLPVDEEDILGKYYDESSGTWRTPDNITQNTDANTITIQASHFTQYGVTYNAKAGGSTPDVPTNLRTKNRKVKTVTLKWSGDADYYKVQLKYKKSGKKVKTYKHVTAKKKKVKKKYGRTNQAYKFRVKACNSSDQCSDFSSYKKFRTKPIKVKSVEFDSENLKLSWHKIRGKGLTYQVKVMDEDGNKIKLYKTKKKSKLLGSVLEAGNTYKVKVRAKYGARNIGAWSKVTTINL